MRALRRIGLVRTQMAGARCSTMRIQFLKLGAQTKVTVRKVWVHVSQAYPRAEIFAAIWYELRTTEPLWSVSKRVQRWEHRAILPDEHRPESMGDE